MISPDFESVWPEVERRLRALLFGRGLDRASADDIVQEVALRALVNGVTYASAKDLLRWAGPVACNLHVDLVRQRSRMGDDEGAEQASSHDVHGEVVDKIELERALRGIAALRPADREAILDAVAEEPFVPRTRKEAVRLAVRRHRARSRLLVLLEQIAAWVAGLAWLRRGKRAAAAVALAPIAVIPVVATWHMLPGDAATPRLQVVAPAQQAAAVERARPEHAALRPRPAVVGSATAVRPRPSARGAQEPPRRPIVTVPMPGGDDPEFGKQDRQQTDHLVCVNPLHLGEVCTPERQRP